ncbi:DUF2691 family protein [Domibacillus sp. PGB-M46]|uniref:DUF2691 family protein n=1 Tax=Domibacillus sp. PGB-M46 TaxID=2910255 RepID=UPI001F560D37|nr:DUF2691 family protein [Domibacillus sp. PGB-M46]MCI2256432.1 DUF2691 family protein [Domibacillus sp. PGB-M46]
MRRGVSFDIPNEYGSLLGDVLKPIDITVFAWRIGSGELYRMENGQLKELFPEGKGIIGGVKIKRLLEDHTYYMIFADLKAYPNGEFSTIDTYEEFLKSKCELVLLVVDCSYVTIYCKNKKDLELLYDHATDRRFKNVEYIMDENDTRASLTVW